MPDIFINRNKNADTSDTGPVHHATELPVPESPIESREPPNERWSEKHKASISLLQEPQRKPGAFTSFAPRPKGMSFEHQEAHEEILLLVRRHFATNLPWILLTVLLVFFPFLLLPILPPEMLEVFRPFFSPAHMLILFLFYYLIVIGFALNQLATWFYQVGIVTNIRIIDVDFNSLLSRNIAYTDITDIVDTEAHQKGLFQSIFNYGNVGVQTAGMKANFEFTSIPFPNKVVDLISDLMRDQKHHG